MCESERVLPGQFAKEVWEKFEELVREYTSSALISYLRAEINKGVSVVAGK